MGIFTGQISNNFAHAWTVDSRPSFPKKRRVKEARFTDALVLGLLSYLILLTLWQRTRKRMGQRKEANDHLHFHLHTTTFGEIFLNNVVAYSFTYTVVSVQFLRNAPILGRQNYSHTCGILLDALYMCSTIRHPGEDIHVDRRKDTNQCTPPTNACTTVTSGLHQMWQLATFNNYLDQGSRLKSKIFIVEAGGSIGVCALYVRTITTLT